ncbi:LuxR family transcriptional regulator [Xenorhabdus mauleonii]|uniref:LuxR family transcriptional regulator n=1 Tax=Xenorhabdus mauleonii TaxID=351675 RepID=A0A1I3HT59_9GAMM|nr:hypothetical protein [Xenorhabdus mauleonii]PHM40281.1 LuxR family transcriptional regulator [Xenorhabdus mauleonii]SFI38924.1 hypothetical protein SAMN05421680_10160 [Xenorhabdus mauleonii]
MKILIIDECHYTRLGAIEFLKGNTGILSIGVESICDAINIFPIFSPDIILVNLTNYGYRCEYNNQMELFISLANQARIYMYINKPYPIGKTPIQLTNKDFILSKQYLATLLERLKKMAPYDIQRYFF